MESKLKAEVTRGQALWQEAKQVVSGGNGLLSKRPERYVPTLWPTYFDKAKGVTITSIDGKTYIDMAQMGIGTALLGYCDNDVDGAVKAAVDKGVNTTLNAPEEVELAQLLLELNPFADQVKFARTGGEAMAMAVRIARAHTKRNRIAFSGYHGWSDWYLAANLAGESLKEHLLPGLSPLGVPEGLLKTAIPFSYNDIDALEDVLAEYEDIGVVVIEGARYSFLDDDMAEMLNRCAAMRGIVIVVDEITSGWRMTDGGVYKLGRLNPDVVVYGKGMGNGYAISAVVGKGAVMSAAQETFISSTFWTERVGFVAALATIKKLCAETVWNHLQKIGGMISDGWIAAADKNNLKITVTDFKPLVTFKLQYQEKNAALGTLFAQEMLRRGYLAAPSVYVSYAHTENIVQGYLAAIDDVFKIMANAIENDTIEALLETPEKEEGFKRLT